MRSLIWVFAERTCNLLRNVVPWFIYWYLAVKYNIGISFLILSELQTKPDNFANDEDPDEMAHNESFYQDLYY